MVNFWKFAALRQSAYWRRVRGEGPPYSDDPALARYHFCNVYREADRGTLWYQEHRTAAAKLTGTVDSQDQARVDLAHELWQSVTYRLLNRVETFQAYGGLPVLGDEDRWLQFLAERMAGGEKAFTGRHQCRGYSRYWATVSWLTDEDGGLALVADAILGAETLEAACSAVGMIPGCGPFFAWQVTCDLMESGALPEYPDAETWALLGPGALAGARLVQFIDQQIPLPPDLLNEFSWTPAVTTAPRALSRKECLMVARMLQATQAECLAAAGAELVPPPQAPGPMSLKNVEHALCEYARYVRACGPLAAGLEVKPWART